MTQPLLLLLALLAVCALVGLAYLMELGREAVTLDRAEIGELIRSLPGQFKPVEIVFAHDNRGALLRDETGRLAVVAPFGAHFLVRECDKGWQAAMQVLDQLEINAPDLHCRLALGEDAGRWLAAINSRAGVVT